MSRGEVSLGITGCHPGVTHRGSRLFPALLLPELLQQLLHRLGRSGAGGTWGCARGARGSPGFRGTLTTPKAPQTPRPPPEPRVSSRPRGCPLRPLKAPCPDRDPQSPERPRRDPSVMTSRGFPCVTARPPPRGTPSSPAGRIQRGFPGNSPAP